MPVNPVQEEDDEEDDEIDIRFGTGTVGVEASYDVEIDGVNVGVVVECTVPDEVYEIEEMRSKVIAALRKALSDITG